MNQENLIPFAKGLSGNPSGKPKGAKSLKPLLKKLLNTEIQMECKLTQQIKNLPLKEHIVLSLITEALKGDIRAIKEIFDRIDGKVVENMRIQEYPQSHLTKKQIDEIVNARYDQ